MAIPTLDQVSGAAQCVTGKAPKVGETWVRKDGRIAEVVAKDDNQFAPLHIKEDNGTITHRTLDGRFALMGFRGACAEDLMSQKEP